MRHSCRTPVSTHTRCCTPFSAPVRGCGRGPAGASAWAQPPLVSVPWDTCKTRTCANGHGPVFLCPSLRVRTARRAGGSGQGAAPGAGEGTAPAVLVGTMAVPARSVVPCQLSRQLSPPEEISGFSEGRGFLQLSPEQRCRAGHGAAIRPQPWQQGRHGQHPAGWGAEIRGPDTNNRKATAPRACTFRRDTLFLTGRSRPGAILPLSRCCQRLRDTLLRCPLCPAGAVGRGWWS